MFNRIFDFLKTHTTIKNKSVLLIYLFVIFFKFDFTIFQFALIRFLKEGLGNEFLIIGILLAMSNFVVMLMDIPLGVLQKYVKPRVFFILATSILLMSNLIFILADLDILLAFFAVFLYQISIEIFFVTITTYIFRLSTEADYAQNMAQQDIADNIGDILGSFVAGILLVLDRLFMAHNLLIGSTLAIGIGLLFLFIFEFIDRKQYTFIENYIFELKPVKVMGDISNEITGKIIKDPEMTGPAIPEGKQESLFQIKIKEIFDKFYTTFTNLINIFVNKSPAMSLLFWISFIVVMTSFWSEIMNDFQPVFLKDIYSETSGWLVDNVPRYFFESLVFIAALVIPTFFLELPIGKLADSWGKEKMIVIGVLVSALSIFFLGVFANLGFVFIFLITLSCGFVITYPSMIAAFNEQYQKFYSSPDSTKETMSDGDSAGIVAIVMNIGQILGALIGGFLLNFLPYRLIFFIFGLVLLAVGIWSKYHLNLNFSFKKDSQK